MVEIRRKEDVLHEINFLFRAEKITSMSFVFGGPSKRNGPGQEEGIRRSNYPDPDLLDIEIIRSMYFRQDQKIECEFYKKTA